MAIPAVSVEIMKVTPKQAAAWLEANEVNRNVRVRLVEAYRRDMEAGNWTFTAEPIQISRTGRLLNGQHRLVALAGSKKLRHLDFVVATGLPDETQAMMDQGAVRNARDALLITHGNVKNVAMAASLCRYMFLVPDIGPGFTPKAINAKVTTAEALQAFDRFPLIPDACSAASFVRPHVPGSPTAIAYAWLAMMRVNDTAANKYFAGMTDMEWSFKNDPRKAVLRRAQALANEPGSIGRESAVMLVSILARGWNAWRAGEEIETINTRSRAGIIPVPKLSK